MRAPGGRGQYQPRVGHVVHFRRHDVQSRLCRTGEHDFFDHLDAGDKVGFFEWRHRPIRGQAAEEGADRPVLSRAGIFHGRVVLGTHSGCATRDVFGCESGRDDSARGARFSSSRISWNNVPLSRAARTRWTREIMMTSVLSFIRTTLKVFEENGTLILARTIVSPTILPARPGSLLVFV